MAPWRDCEPCHSQPDGGNQPTDPPSGQLNVVANSRRLGPQGHFLSTACRIPPAMAARPPTSCRCGCLAPPSSPSIGIWLGPFAFPYPSSMVSTTRTSRFGGFGFRRFRYYRGRASSCVQRYPALRRGCVALTGPQGPMAVHLGFLLLWQGRLSPSAGCSLPRSPRRWLHVRNLCTGIQLGLGRLSAAMCPHAGQRRLVWCAGTGANCRPYHSALYSSFVRGLVSCGYGGSPWPALGLGLLFCGTGMFVAISLALVSRQTRSQVGFEPWMTSESSKG